MIKIKHLYLRYIKEYYALYDINLDIKKNECVAFTGKEHSGRTTLLRVIAGLEKYDNGEVFIQGRDLKTINFSTDINLGYVPVMPVFFENKTVYENLVYVLSERKYSKIDIETKINQALIDYNIEKYKNILVKDLDLYEKYIISFIRLSLRDLDILLVDNIFGKLSKDDSEAILNLIETMFLSKKVTTVIVSDEFEPLQNICSREIKFNSGSVIE